MKILPPETAGRSSLSVTSSPQRPAQRAPRRWHASCEGTVSRDGTAHHVMSRLRLDGLVSWRAARALAAAVHRATAGVPFQADLELRTELRRAATDIMTALAEGYEQRTCGEFDRRLATAVGATARLQSLICLAEDMGLLTRETLPQLRRRVTETAELLDALRQVVTRYQRLQAMPAPPQVN